MSSSTSALDDVMGTLFDRGHRKPRGGGAGQGGRPGIMRAAGGASRRPSLSRLRLAAAADGHAVFKLIRNGGTQGRSGLKGQLNYIFRDDKLARVLDPTGRIAPDVRPENADINRLTLDWSTDWWRNTRNGNTSHMILSYPHGVTVDEVEIVTRAVCEEMLEGAERRFKYIAAIHDDTDHHSHAHVIVNRRADDNTLFNMRSGTQHSYEAFREAMAEHGRRIGLRLDPSFRFERGIEGAQPTRSEQLEAQRQGRAPVQQLRQGAALAAQRELIAYSRIAFEAMSVIAHNADAPRLEEAYRTIAATIETNPGDLKMPELSADEMERFDQYTDLLEKTIARAEEVIETKSAAARAPMERQLDDIMRAFTSLSPKAPYARDLHEAPGAATIYMHGLGERGAALTSPEVQQHMIRVAQKYGLDAEAITARLQTGAESRRLEDAWLLDDLRRVARRADLDLTDRDEQEEVVGRLEDAYDAMRVPLVKDRVLTLVPHLEDDYAWRPPRSETYRFDADRLGTDVGTLIRHYSDHGAPREWIDANRAQLADDLALTYKTERADYLRRHPELVRPLTEAVHPDGKGGVTIVDRGRAEDVVEALPPVDRSELRDAVGQDLVRRHPDMPHHVVDHLAALTVATRDAVEQTRAHDPFEGVRARGKSEKDLSRNRDEHRDLIRLIRQHTTGDQYARLERGDLSAVSHITTDPVFARQLVREVDIAARGIGTRYDPSTEARLTAHREYLDRTFDRDRDDEYDRER